MSGDLHRGYVRLDTGEYLVQLPDGGQWGFSLHSDDQSWPGGFGCGSTEWTPVAAGEVPAEVRAWGDDLIG